MDQLGTKSGVDQSRVALCTNELTVKTGEEFEDMMVRAIDIGAEQDSEVCPRKEGGLQPQGIVNVAGEAKSRCEDWRTDRVDGEGGVCEVDKKLNEARSVYALAGPPLCRESAVAAT